MPMQTATQELLELKHGKTLRALIRDTYLAVVNDPDEDGEPFHVTADRLNVSHQSLYNWMRAMKPPLTVAGIRKRKRK
jgi:hypothetical protein